MIRKSDGITKWKHDDRPQRYMWAPGDYISECWYCHEYFIGAKRASSCADCAYADFNMDEDRDF